MEKFTNHNPHPQSVVFSEVSVEMIEGSDKIQPFFKYGVFVELESAIRGNFTW